MDVQTINKLFREYGRTLGSVESFTGGLFAREITAVPGASHFFILFKDVSILNDINDAG